MPSFPFRFGLIALAVIVEAATAVGTTLAQQAPQEAPVTNCDTYAASDSDPQHKAKGVPFESINSALAVPACESAVRQFPDSTRLIFQLGRAYSKRNDFGLALVQYRKAVERGHPAAQYGLGIMHANGQGVAQNYAEAAMWYRKAADQGHALAQNNLGALYANGQGVQQNYAEAVTWYRKAADQGNALAQNNLGAMYVNGQGVKQSYVEAMRWYRKAADQGNSGAQSNVGILYMNGFGVPQDYAQALSWYRKAADQGDVGAKNNLGVMYENGRGVPQDKAEAAMWYRRAAENGNTVAQNNLAALYEKFPALRSQSDNATSVASNVGAPTTPQSSITSSSTLGTSEPWTQITSLSDYAKHIKHQWMKYGEYRGGTSYIDLASVIRTGDTLTVLDMQDWNPPVPVGTTGEYIGSAMYFVRYDCGSPPRSMIMAGVVFHGHMGSGTQQEGAADVPNEPPDGWHVMKAGENNEMLKARNMACNGGRATIAAPSDKDTYDARVRALSDKCIRESGIGAPSPQQQANIVSLCGVRAQDQMQRLQQSCYRSGDIAALVFSYKSSGWPAQMAAEELAKRAPIDVVVVLVREGYSKKWDSWQDFYFEAQRRCLNGDLF